MPSLRSRPKYPKCCTTPPQPLHYAYFYRKRSPQMLALPQSLRIYMVSGHCSCRFQSEVIFVKRHGEINTRGQFSLSWLEWEEGDTTKNPKMQKTVTHSWVPLSQRQVSRREDSAPDIQTSALSEHTRPSHRPLCPNQVFPSPAVPSSTPSAQKNYHFTIQIPTQNLTSSVLSPRSWPWFWSVNLFDTN